MYGFYVGFIVGIVIGTIFGACIGIAYSLYIYEKYGKTINL